MVCNPLEVWGVERSSLGGRVLKGAHECKEHHAGLLYSSREQAKQTDACYTAPWMKDGRVPPTSEPGVGNNKAARM